MAAKFPLTIFVVIIIIIKEYWANLTSLDLNLLGTFYVPELHLHALSLLIL